MELPEGVLLKPIECHSDSRGWVTEIHRENWEPYFNATQWNVFFSRKNTLRGVHLHHQRTDYVFIAQGNVRVGMKDVRAHSATADFSCMISLSEAVPQILMIPPGVAHGFFSETENIMVLGMNYGWEMKDELGCSWNDPDLEMVWPCDQPILSERDINACSYKKMKEYYHAK